MPQSNQVLKVTRPAPIKAALVFSSKVQDRLDTVEQSISFIASGHKFQYTKRDDSYNDDGARREENKDAVGDVGPVVVANNETSVTLKISNGKWLP